MPMQPCESNDGSLKETIIFPKQSLSMKARVKVPLAMLGQWKHPKYGEVTFTQQDFDQMRSNYLSNSLGYRPYLTFGHLEEEPNSTDSHRKRGDMEAFIQEGEVMYGLFETPDYVANMVMKGEYEYSSGEFIRNLMDKKEGKDLGCAVSRVALTNSPFIPFEDVKVHTLSQTMEGRVQVITINLSQESKVTEEAPLETPKEDPSGVKQATQEEVKDQGEQESQPPQIEAEKGTEKVHEVKEEPMEDQINTAPAPEVKSEEQKVENLPTQPETPTPTVTQSTLAPTPAAPQPSQPAPQPVPQPTAPTTQMINVEDLIQQVRAGIQAEFQAERLQSQTLINKLQTEVNSLKGELTKQNNTVQVFSQTVAKAQEEAQQKQLLMNGMPPVVIPKYIALHNAVVSGKQVMKLSMGAEGEKEVSTLTLLHDVVSECLSLGGVPLNQLGTTTSIDSSNSGGLIGDIKAIIEKNKQLANNK